MTFDSPCRFMAGYASVLALITAWVAQSEISQALQTGGFNQPIALVWLNHSILVLLLPLTLMVWHSDRAAVLLCRCCSMERPRAVPFRPSLCEAVWRSHRLSRTRLLVSACGLAIIYFLGDLVWYCALPHLSVATGTAMFNSSCAFTFAFGAWLLRERVSALKLIGVCVALIGVVVIALFPGANMAGGGGDSSASLASHLVAAALVLSAALLYGYYEVLFKVVVESGLHLPRSLCEMVCGCGFARAESRALLRGVVDVVDVTSRTGADAALALIDTAIETISGFRAELGAKENRITKIKSNLDVTYEALSAGNARIREVDVASEMASFTKNQILVQASTSMLAQANSFPEVALSLLG